MVVDKKRVRTLPKKFDSKTLRKMFETNRHYYDSNVLSFVLKRIDHVQSIKEIVQ